MARELRGFTEQIGEVTVSGHQCGMNVCEWPPEVVPGRLVSDSSVTDGQQVNSWSVQLNRQRLPACHCDVNIVTVEAAVRNLRPFITWRGVDAVLGCTSLNAVLIRIPRVVDVCEHLVGFSVVLLPTKPRF